MAEPDVTPGPRRWLGVLAAYSGGEATPEVATRLGVTPGRVRKMMSDLYQRLGVHNATEAATLLDERFPGWRERAA